MVSHEKDPTSQPADRMQTMGIRNLGVFHTTKAPTRNHQNSQSASHNVAIAKEISDSTEPILPSVKPSWWKWCNLMINYGTDNGVERSATPSAAASERR